MQSSWSVLTIIFCISKELHSSATTQSCSVLMLLWLCLHMSWWLSLILFSGSSSKDCLYSVYRKPLPSSDTSCGQFVWTCHLCLNTRCSLQRLCPCHSHPHSPLMTLCLKRPDPWFSLSSSHSPILWINGGPSWTGRGTDQFLPSLFEAGPSSRYQFRHVLIALYRAVFTPSFDLLAVYMGPLVLMMVE